MYEGCYSGVFTSEHSSGLLDSETLIRQFALPRGDYRKVLHISQSGLGSEGLLINIMNIKLCHWRNE